jgi:hypothetical protein
MKGIVVVLCMGLILVLVYQVAVKIVNHDYRRYVSPPLPDGTRYTFLYPKYLKAVRANWFGHSFGMMDSVHIDSGQETFTLLDRLRAWVGIPYQPRDGFAQVIVGRMAPRFGTSRRETMSTSSTENAHDVILIDGRSHLRLWLTYREESHPDQFARDSPVVARSFCVLPPGAPIPAP